MLWSRLQLTPLTGTETHVYLLHLLPSLVATHTPHGNGNIIVISNVGVPLLVLQITPLTGTETSEMCQHVYEFIVATHTLHGDGNVCVLLEITITHRCNSHPSRGRKRLTRKRGVLLFRVATHTPHGDGNNIIDKSCNYFMLQLTPLTGTETITNA